jgi:hypothetical protein
MPGRTHKTIKHITNIFFIYTPPKLKRLYRKIISANITSAASSALFISTPPKNKTTVSRENSSGWKKKEMLKRSCDQIVVSEKLQLFLLLITLS